MRYYKAPVVFRLDADALHFLTFSGMVWDSDLYIPFGAPVTVRQAAFGGRTWLVIPGDGSLFFRRYRYRIRLDLLDISHDRWMSEVLPRLTEWAVLSTVRSPG